MKRKNKWINYLVSILLFFSMFQTQSLILGAESNVISVEDVQDLITLAKHCSLDTWSQGKVIELMTDLDVSQADFTQIPTFGGTFEGNGHLISGLNLSDSGEVQGLFRYIQSGGKVKNLQVEGVIIPEGTKNILGGIAGKNAGIIKGSSFTGQINGKSNVGGIAGVNEATGEIIGCTASGQISGEHYVGGVAGENLGTILNSTSEIDINVVVSVQKITMEDIEQINLEKINSTENTTAITDVGGITGFSTGIIQGCSNMGTVGYPHIGYNIGGIAGRQSGYVKDCINEGLIYGRKDVGGIVGQMEPYIALDFSESKLSNLRNELNKLQNLIDETVGHANNMSADISNGLNETKEGVDQAINTARTLLDDTKDLYNEAVDSVNNVSARVTDTLQELDPIMEEAKGVGVQLEEVADQLMEVVAKVKVTNSDGEALIEQIKKAVTQFKDDASKLSDYLADIDDALENLGDSIGDDEEIGDALELLNRGVSRLGEQIIRIGEDFKSISQAMSDLKAEVGKNWEVLRQDLTRIGEVLVNVGTAVKQMGQTIKTANKDIKMAAKSVLYAVVQIAEGFKELSEEIDLSSVPSALEEFLDAMKALREESEDLLDENNELENIGDLGEDISEDLDGVLEEVQDVLDTTQDIVSKGTQIADDLYEVISNLAAQPVISLPNINSNLIDHTHELTDHLNNISGLLGNLNTDLTENSQVLISDIERINNQLYVVFNLMLDYVDSEDEESIDIEDYKQDISDEDTQETTQGKVAACTNKNIVEGDLNVGGITGSMAIEYDFDPEDDVTRLGKTSVNFKYLTKAVVRDCTNMADITSKKNDVGGIVGHMDLGTVISSIAYGRVEGKDGDNVGGIAGFSNSHIKGSFSMCTLAGNRSVGGIAGYGTRLTNNYAMIEIERAVEKIGAIAGSTNSLTEQSNNFFVDRGQAGIDSISYTGKAVPMSYEEFITTPNLPKAFTNLKLIFMADGVIIKSIPFAFGESLDESQIPLVPEKEGYYGEWSEFDKESLTFSKTLEAIYTPYRLVLSSDLTKEGKAVVLAEGRFDNNSGIRINAVDKDEAGIPDKNVEVWHVALTGVTHLEASYPIRLLSNKEKEASVYALQSDGSWKQVEAVKNGSYLLVDMEGSEQSFYIAYEDSRMNSLLASGGIMILLTGGILFIRSRKKKVNQDINIS